MPRLHRPVPVPAALTAAALLLSGCSAVTDPATPVVPVAQRDGEDPRAPGWLPSSEPDAGSVPSSPLPLPPAPSATASPAATGAPSSPRPAPTAAPENPELPCDGTAGERVTGDLDGDGAPETAVPVSCPAADAVVVYSGLYELGNALPAEEGAELHAVEVRDGYLLVVGRVELGEGEADDVALTTRWQVRDGALVRTDRWLDPASVLGVDAG